MGTRLNEEANADRPQPSFNRGGNAPRVLEWAAGKRGPMGTRLNEAEYADRPNPSFNRGGNAPRVREWVAGKRGPMGTRLNDRRQADTRNLRLTAAATPRAFCERGGEARPAGHAVKRRRRYRLSLQAAEETRIDAA
ncbi:hypothetical protein [Rosistilla oblonga]|uniref:hypothetical protein n=1 Tax=Rosistilla oblonga TaxID=2527990 RepID=UPI003A975239